MNCLATASMRRLLPRVLYLLFLATPLAVPLASQGRSAEGENQPPPRPNVIFILSDDQGFADIGYHNDKVYTPNLDRLALSGVRFSNSYVMPQCTPTRVALMTGRYPSRFGGTAMQASNAPAFPKGTPTLAGLFQEAGYQTHLCGKWHLGTSFEHGPQNFGFDHSYGALTGAVGNYNHRYRKGRFAETWHRDHQPIAGCENGIHTTDLLAAEAVRIIRAKRNQPFFLYLPFFAIHTPLDERGKFVDQPTQLDPKRPGRWRNEDEIPWFHDPKGKIQAEKDPEKRLLLAATYHLDDAIGQIVTALDETGQRKNTMIVFSSDNGPQGSWPGNAYPDDLKLTDFNQPLPFRGKKRDVYEGGIHVPGFANWPGRLKPREETTPIHVVDWMPTFASLLLQFAPVQPTGTTGAWDGVDLRALLFENKPLTPRDIYWSWGQNTNRWALLYGPWKLVHYGRKLPPGPEGWELYNLVTDPKESTDVADRFAEPLAMMHRRFLAQRAKDKPGRNGPNKKRVKRR